MGCVQANTLQPRSSAVIMQPAKRRVFGQLNQQFVGECSNDKLATVDNRISDMQFIQLGSLLGTSAAQMKQNVYANPNTRSPSFNPLKNQVRTLSQDSYIHTLFSHILTTQTCQSILNPLIFTHLQQLYNSSYFTPYNKSRLIVLLENYARFADSLQMGETGHNGKDGMFRFLSLVGKEFGRRVGVLIHDVGRCQAQLDRLVTQLPLSQTQELKLHKLKAKLIQINKNYKQDTFKNLIFYSYILKFADNQLRKGTKPEQIYQQLLNKYKQIEQLRNKRKNNSKQQQQKAKQNQVITNIIHHLYFSIKEDKKNSNVVISFQDFYKYKNDKTFDQSKYRNDDKENIKERENNRNSKQIKNSKKAGKENLPLINQFDEEKMKYLDQYLQKILTMSKKVIPHLQKIAYQACIQNQGTLYIEYTPATSGNISQLKQQLLHNYLNKPKPKVPNNGPKQICQLLKSQKQDNINKLKYILFGIKQFPFNITNLLCLRAFFSDEEALCQALKKITKTINDSQYESIKLVDVRKPSSENPTDSVIKVEIKGFAVQIVLQLKKNSKNDNSEQLEEIYYKNIEADIYSSLLNAYIMYNTSANQIIEQVHRIYPKSGKKQQNELLSALETLKKFINGDTDSNITHKNKQVVCLNILKQQKEDRAQSNNTHKLNEGIKLRSMECLKEMGLYGQAFSIYTCGKTNDVVARSKQQQIIAQIYCIQSNYQKSLEHYTIAELLYAQAPSLQYQPLIMSIADIHSKLYNYPKALQYYTKALRIREHLDKKQSIEKAILLYNIVQMRRKIGVSQFIFNNDILAVYQRCFDIVSDLKGQYSIDCAILYNNIGSCLEENGQYNEALHKYNKALFIYEKYLGKFYVQCVLTLNNLGNVFKKRQVYSQAVDYYQKCLKINECLQSHSLDFRTNMLIKINLSICYRQIHKPGKALQILQTCLKQIQSQKLINNSQIINLRLIEAKIFQNIGQTFQMQHDYKTALREFEKSLSIFSQVGDGQVDVIRVKIMMGMAYQMTGDNQISLRIYKQCQQLQQTMELKQPQQEIKIYICLGKAYQKVKNYQQSREYLLKSLQVYQINKISSIQKAQLLNKIGLIYQKLQDYKTALKYFQQSHQIVWSEYGSSNIQVADVLANCARMYRFSDKDYDQRKAVQKYNQCYMIYLNAFGYNSHQCGTILNQLGRAYMQIEEYNETISCYTKALTIQKQLKGPQSPQYCDVLRNISDLYFNMNTPWMSVQILTKCLKIEQKARGKQSADYAKTLFHIANIYQKMKNHESALRAYQQLSTIYKEVKQENIERNNESKIIQQKIVLMNSKITK